MGRKRAQFILSQLARLYPEQHKSLVHEADRVERQARHGGEDARLLDRCTSLLQELQTQQHLVPYVAQGCPACLTAVLARVSSNNDMGGVMLRLATLLAASGGLIDAVMDGISSNAAAYVAHVCDRDAESAQLAGTLLSTAVHLASDGEQLAAQLLLLGGDADFWQQFDSAFLDAEPQRPTAVLSVCLSLLRACCGANGAVCTAVAARLPRLCALEAVRRDAQVRGEALQLLAVLGTTVGETDRGSIAELHAALVAPVEEDDDRNENKAANGETERTFSEALAALDDEIPTVALSAVLDSLQKNQFDSEARLQDLHAIARLLFAPRDPEGVAAALLVLMPGAIKGVFAAASDVDESLSAYACTILASAIDGKWVAAGETHQHLDDQRKHLYKDFDASYYQKCLVECFFLLGGVVLLEDLVTDYSNGVVVAALRLVQSLLRFSDSARDVILASKCIRNLSEALDTISQDGSLASLIQCADEESVLLHGLDTIAMLSGEEVRLVPENTLASIGTIATGARANSRVLSTAIRALTLLAMAYPMAATLVLDYDYLSNVLAPDGNDVDDNKDINSNSAPSGIDSIYLVGSFDIMAAIVAQQPSSVTFEWIETLAAASRRLQDWETEVPGYAAAFWNVVLQTVVASDDGLAYLFEDEEFVQALLSALTRSCRLSLPVKRRGRDDGSGGDDAVDDACCDGKRTQAAAELLPLLVQVAKHMPSVQSRPLPAGAGLLLEAVALLVAARRDDVSPDVLADVVVSLMADDVFRSSALDVLADAGPSVVSELLGRVRSFLTTATTAIETAAADDVETITPYPGAEDRSTPEAFDATLTALCGVLQRSDVSHNHTTLEAVADLAVAAFKALNEPPVIAPSSYTCILRSLWELMRVEREHVKEVARHLWYDDNVVELLSRLLQSLRDRNDAAETRGAVYDVVWLLCDLQNTPSSPSPTFPHDDNAFLAFAAEHILHDCHEPACRSLLMELCAHPSFRSYMLEFHEAAYRAAVHLAVAEKEEYSAAAVAALLSQCDASKK